MEMFACAEIKPCLSRVSKSVLLTRRSSRIIAFALEMIGSNGWISRFE